jgi:hypothetical protein
MRLSAQLKKMLRISFMTMYLAGTLYWLFRAYFRRAGEFGEEPHLIERLTGPLHLLAGFTFLFVIGIVWTDHVTVALKAKRHRVTGWVFLAFMAILAASGVCNVYGGPKLLKVTELLHPIVGTLLLPLLAVHWKTRKKKATLSRLV